MIILLLLFFYLLILQVFKDNPKIFITVLIITAGILYLTIF